MITVLRLGHRRGRDDRISSHVGLTARQFGADRIIYSGEHDTNMLESLSDVVSRWGGDFQVDYTDAWRPVIRDFSGSRVHLTMYGIPHADRLDTVQEAVVDGDDDLLVVVGGEKVRPEVYDMVDHNLSVGTQPHSEVAALAVFLHDLFDGAELDRTFADADIRVVPQERGKKTVEPGDADAGS